MYGMIMVKLVMGYALACVVAQMLLVAAVHGEHNVESMQRIGDYRHKQNVFV